MPKNQDPKITPNFLIYFYAASLFILTQVQGGRHERGGEQLRRSVRIKVLAGHWHRGADAGGRRPAAIAGLGGARRSTKRRIAPQGWVV